MNNKGRVVVFLTLLMSAMLLLAFTVIEIIDLKMAQSKVAMVSRTAMSDVESYYNSYIFEHYHVLLFDTNFSGKGEAYGEEIMRRCLEKNLDSQSEDYEIEEIAVTDYQLLIENDCEPLKKQIEETVPYLGAAYGVEQLLEKTGGKDGTLPENVLTNMEQAQVEATSNEEKKQENGSEQNDDDSDTQHQAGTVNMGDDLLLKGETKDPRKYTTHLSWVGVLSIVAPEDVELFDGNINLINLPSKKIGGISNSIFSANKKFDNYDDLKKDLNKRASFNDKLLAAGSGILYARSCFNCLTNKDVNSTSVLTLEQEYLICGKQTEQENFKGVVMELIGIRFPLDYGYLVTDVAKMGEISEISVPLSLITGVPEPILKYLLAGCWSYVEAIADVRALTNGGKISFTKNATNWITDFSDLENSVCNESREDEKGLCYEDYLMILMSLNMDKTYLRMLDLMQINANQTVDFDENSFDILKAAVGLEADISVSYKNHIVKLHQQKTY